MSMNARNDQGPQREPDAARDADTRVRPVLLFVVFVAAVVGGCVLLSTLILRLTLRGSSRAELVPSTASAPTPVEPRLQVFPQQDLNELQRSKHAVLQHYGWRDRRAGVVHLPVSRALELAVKRGLKTFTPAAPTSTQPGPEEPTP